MKKPVLITVFGIDGSGKTTQCKKLQAFLAQRGYKVAYVWARREPFVLKPLIALVKRRILKETKPVEHGAYKEIARHRHKFFSNRLIREIWFWISLIEYRLLLSCRVFLPNKDANVIICDRYIVDALVDLATNYNAGVEGIQELFNHPAVRLFPKPSVSLFLDLPAEIGAGRKADGTSIPYLADRVALYRSAATATGAFSADGTGAPEDLAEAVQKVVSKHMGIQ